MAGKMHIYEVDRAQLIALCGVRTGNMIDLFLVDTAPDLDYCSRCYKARAKKLAKACANTSTKRTVHKECRGVYTIIDKGEQIGSIIGSEHYTGLRRKYWIVNVQDDGHCNPINHLLSFREAKAWAGVGA